MEDFKSAKENQPAFNKDAPIEKMTSLLFSISSNSVQINYNKIIFTSPGGTFELLLDDNAKHEIIDNLKKSDTPNSEVLKLSPNNLEVDTSLKEYLSGFHLENMKYEFFEIPNSNKSFPTMIFKNHGNGSIKIKLEPEQEKSLLEYFKTTNEQLSVKDKILGFILGDESTVSASILEKNIIRLNIKLPKNEIQSENIEYNQQDIKKFFIDYYYSGPGCAQGYPLRSSNVDYSFYPNRKIREEKILQNELNSFFTKDGNINPEVPEETRELFEKYFINYTLLKNKFSTENPKLLAEEFDGDFLVGLKKQIRKTSSYLFFDGKYSGEANEDAGERAKDEYLKKWEQREKDFVVCAILSLLDTYTMDMMFNGQPDRTKRYLVEKKKDCSDLGIFTISTLSRGRKEGERRDNNFVEMKLFETKNLISFLRKK